MDKIQEAFEKARQDVLKFVFIESDYALEVFIAGYKSADLLPTEKVCPECGGELYCASCGVVGEADSCGGQECPTCGKEMYESECPVCEGEGIIQIYYTPEQYEEIMGKPYPDDALIWTTEYSVFENKCVGWKVIKFAYAWKSYKGATHDVVIIQTAQPAPPADYRAEE